MVFYCCVSGCGKTNKEEKMYSFPKCIENARKWLSIIGRQDLLQKHFECVRKSYRICGVHFDDTYKFMEYHNRTNLKCDAIPTLHIPDIKRLIMADIVDYVNMNDAMQFSVNGEQYQEDSLLDDKVCISETFITLDNAELQGSIWNGKIKEYELSMCLDNIKTQLPSFEVTD